MCKTKCDECNVEFNDTTQYKGKFLCKVCFRKLANTIWTRDILEDKDKNRIISTFKIKDSLLSLMIDRIKQLFGKYKMNKGKYIKMLILRDLKEVYNEKKEENN